MMEATWGRTVAVVAAVRVVAVDAGAIDEAATGMAESTPEARATMES